MPNTPEFEAALDAVSRAADAMAHRCYEYETAKTASGGVLETLAIEALRKACDAAREAHDEAYADAWALIEEQPS